MNDYGREVRKILAAHGWYLHRMAKGDHELWAAKHSPLKITDDRTIKSRHTANGIMKRAGIGHRF